MEETETLPVEDETQGPTTEPTPVEPVTTASEVDPRIREEGETPETPEAADAKSVEKPDGVQKRFDELTRAKYDALREAAYWKGKAEGGAVKPELTAPDAEAKPKQDQYESYEAYIEAVTDWKLTARLTAERSRMREEDQAQTAAKGFEAQVSRAREKHADFDAVVYSQDLQISETMRETLLQSEDGASLAYHLGQNPEEAARIASLPERAQIMAIGRLQAKLEAPALPAAPGYQHAGAGPALSKAPQPIQPLKAGAPVHHGLREDLPIGDWMRRRTAELQRR